MNLRRLSALLILAGVLLGAGFILGVYVLG
jgi:hypothetical protein